MNRFRRDFHGYNDSLTDSIGRCYCRGLESLRFMMFRNRVLNISASLYRVGRAIWACKGRASPGLCFGPACFPGSPDVLPNMANGRFGFSGGFGDSREGRERRYLFYQSRKSGGGQGRIVSLAVLLFSVRKRTPNLRLVSSLTLRKSGVV